MPRKVFFNFHYDDVTRANVVRNADQITRKYHGAVRFYDKSLWENAKKQGPLAIKRMIHSGLDGSSITCVLIGAQTWGRRWVRYEILKSVARGNGILGVRIHNVGFAPKDQPITSASVLAPASRNNALSRYSTVQQPVHGGLLSLAAQRSSSQPNSLLAAFVAGENPLRYLGYTIDRQLGMVRFYELGSNGQWQEAEVPAVPLRNLPWMARLKDSDNLSSLFSIYDWKQDYGSFYFPTWVEDAAKQVGR